MEYANCSIIYALSNPSRIYQETFFAADQIYPKKGPQTFPLKPLISKLITELRKNCNFDSMNRKNVITKLEKQFEINGSLAASGEVSDLTNHEQEDWGVYVQW